MLEREGLWQKSHREKLSHYHEVLQERIDFLKATNDKYAGFGGGDPGAAEGLGGLGSLGFGSEISGTAYDDVINAAARKHGVDAFLIAAIIQVESSFNNNVTSHAGAQGLMQIMPVHGLSNPFDPEENVNFGAKYIKEMLNRYNDDAKKALSAYNAGPGNVNKWVKEGIWPEIPFKETRAYYPKIDKAYQKFTGGNSIEDGPPGGAGGNFTTNLSGGIWPSNESVTQVHNGRVIHTSGNRGSFNRSVVQAKMSNNFNDLVTLPKSRFFNNFSSTQKVAPELLPFCELIYEAMKTNNQLTNGKVPVNSVFRNNRGASAHDWGGAIDIGTKGRANAVRIADMCWGLGFRAVAIGGNISGGSGFVHVDVGPPGQWSYSGNPVYKGPGTF